jgi:hypothetical protein
MDPDQALDPALNPSIIKQIARKTLIPADL